MKATIVVIGALAFAGSLSGQEAVRQDAKSLVVTRASGAQETYDATWVATLGVSKWESGGPSALLTGKFLDDRRCHWTIEAAVQRRVYLVDADGHRLEKTGLAKTLPVRLGTQAQALEAETARNCSGMEAGFRADAERAKATLDRRFSALVREDGDDLVSEMRKWHGIRSVSPAEE